MANPELSGDAFLRRARPSLTDRSRVERMARRQPTLELRQEVCHVLGRLPFLSTAAADV